MYYLPNIANVATAGVWSGKRGSKFSHVVERLESVRQYYMLSSKRPAPNTPPRRDGMQQLGNQTRWTSRIYHA